ncbi:MAG: hypothetical protein AAGL17_21555, partial [Cyanobacteria bacterium J06576_12]
VFDLDQSNIATFDADFNPTAVGAAVSAAVAKGAAAIAVGGVIVLNKTNSTIESAIVNSSTVSAATGISTLAKDTATVNATLTGVSAAISIVGLALGAAISENEIDNTVSAFAKNARLTAATGGIDIEAIADQSASAKTTVAAVSTTVSANGGFAETTLKGTVEAYASQATLSANQGDINILANSKLSADTDIRGGAGAPLSLTALVSETVLEGATRAYIGGGTTNANARDVTVRATGSETVKANGLAAGIGAVGVRGIKTTAKDNRNIDAYIGTAQGASSVAPTTIAATGKVTVDATGTSTVEADFKTISAATLISAALSKIEAEAAPKVSAYLGEGSAVSAVGDISVDAFANVKGKAKGAGVAGAITAAGSVTDVVVNVSPTVRA